MNEKNIEKTNLPLQQIACFASAIRRLDIIQNNVAYQEYEIPEKIITNTTILLKQLSRFLKFLHPDEIGPTNNGTMILNFEMGDEHLVLEIGETTMAHVFSGVNYFTSGSSVFDDVEYNKELIDLFYRFFSVYDA